MSKIGNYVISELEKGNDVMYDASQEPVYDKPIELPCYEKWDDSLQQSPNELNESGEYYEYYAVDPT